jgi:hypothetical protein
MYEMKTNIKNVIFWCHFQCATRSGRVHLISLSMSKIKQNEFTNPISPNHIAPNPISATLSGHDKFCPDRFLVILFCPDRCPLSLMINYKADHYLTGGYRIQITSYSPKADCLTDWHRVRFGLASLRHFSTNKAISARNTVKLCLL